MTDSKPTARLLVVDLDDTLWTWFQAWHESFRALVDELVKLSGIDEDTLLTAIRPVHQHRGTTEYSWLIDELEILEEAVPPGTSRIEYYHPAIHAQNRARKAGTALYPGVRETLERLGAQGTNVVAYTESLAFWTWWRIDRTDLDGLLTEIYSSKDHDAPLGVVPSDRRYYPADKYELKETIHRHVPAGELKPNPGILQKIIDDQGVSPEETVYVGDSLVKDVTMAQAVQAIDAYAAYGVQSRDPRYALLQRVSHWTDAMVQHEQDTRPGVHPTPSITLKSGLSELFDHVTFVPTAASKN